MTVKERVHQLVDELPEEELLTIEQRLQELRHWTEVAPEKDDRAETPEERRAGVLAGLGSLKDVPGSVDDFYRRKSEEIDQEEEQAARRMAGQG
jgi:hypothetical protein